MIEKDNGGYREHLIQAEHKSQTDYDKTLISLSGGGLALSLVFIEKIAGEEVPRLLFY